MKMKVASLSVVLLVVLATACGSGGGSGGGTVKSGLSAGFTPDQPSPGSNTVAMDEGSISGDLVTIDVEVTDTSGIYGAAFDLAFDSGKMTYEGWSPGSLLEQGGHTPSYQVTAFSDQILVSASRQGNVSGASASGSTPVVRLTFRVTEAGGHTVTFQGDELLDDSVQPQPIPGVNWFAGAVTGI